MIDENELRILKNSMLIVNAFTEQVHHITTAQDFMTIHNRNMETIIKISDEMPIFNQMPFEPVFENIHKLVVEDKDLCPSGKTSEFFINYIFSIGCTYGYYC